MNLDEFKKASDALNAKYHAKPVMTLKQKANKDVVFGKCYGYTNEWSLYKLDPASKTVYRHKKIFPLMPIEKLHKYNFSVNHFISSSPRVNTYQWSQVPFYRTFANAYQKSALNLLHITNKSRVHFFEKGLDKLVTKMDHAYDDGEYNKTCTLMLMGGFYGHAMGFKKNSNGKIEFFDCNSHEYNFENLNDFRAWLPKYVALNYPNLFYAFSIEVVQLNRFENKPESLTQKISGFFNNILPQLLIAPLGSLLKIPSVIKYIFTPKMEKSKIVDNSTKYSLDDNMMTTLRLIKTDLLSKTASKQTANFLRELPNKTKMVFSSNHTSLKRDAINLQDHNRQDVDSNTAIKNNYRF